MADFGNADDKVPRTVDNLAIRTNQDLDNFWRAILPQFLDVVDPDSDGTLNQLYEDFALTDTDRESLVAAEKDNVPRKKRARRLFSILSTLGLEVFLSSSALSQHLLGYCAI
nr:hypothetical protein BaRGS_027665 [Batillaria attramentaria]